jgi:ribonuclease HI
MGTTTIPHGWTHCHAIDAAATFPCTTSTLPKHGIQLYTDGSSTKGPDGSNVIGAGVYNATTQECTRINPGGMGSTHTNNRAELVALHVAMTSHPADQDLTIYTDSLCSIQNTRKMLDRPHQMQESKHRVVVEQLIQVLAQRAMAGGHTYLKKVRSHTGIHGNDEADRLAKEATDPKMPIDTHVIHGETAHEGMAWPSHKTQITPAGPAFGPHPHMHRWTQAANLTADIKNKAPHSYTTGFASKEGVYAKLWEKTNPQLHKPSSHRYWKDPNITWSQRITILKLRWGKFWNKKLAYRYRMRYAADPNPAHDANCPICKQGMDGAGHILAGCKDPHMKGFYINRHNRAVNIIQKAVAKGALGNSYMIMDAGKHDELPATVRMQRMPDTLRPPSSVTADTWQKLRPDLVMITGMLADETPTHGMKLHMEMVEVGYCSDTNHDVKLQEKEQQHAQLQALLKEAGHTVRYHAITLGTTGTTRKETLETLQQLGLALPQALQTMNKLHQNAISSVSDIVRARRIREWQTVLDTP